MVFDVMRTLSKFLILFLLSLGVAHAQPSWYPASGTQTCNENFTGSTLNYGNWDVNHNGAIEFWANGAQDVGTPWNYTMIPGGGVSIVARHQNFDVTPFARANFTSMYITSGSNGALGCGQQTYGYFELKTKMPPITGGANGLWPAYWMEPQAGGTIPAWEMDFFERFTSEPNNPFDHTWATFTLHWNNYANFAYICTIQDTAGWGGTTHVFGVDWEPNGGTPSLQEYVDGSLCTDSTYNPTGTYTGSGVPTQAGYVLFDQIMDQVGNNAQVEQLNTLNGGAYQLLDYHVYQQNANPQTQQQPVVGSQVTFDRPMNGASPPIYAPGDSVVVSTNVTAGNAADNGVFITVTIWDWCKDNGGAGSNCMYPYNNTTYGTATNSATQNLSANQTSAFSVTYALPVPTASKSPPPGYLYLVQVNVKDTAGGQWNSWGAIQVGNPKP